MNKFSPRLLPAVLVLGVPEIDEQHEALFAQLIFLKDLCLREKRLPAEEAKRLVDALREHYDTEERLAHAMGTNFSEHARQHDVMLLAVTKTLKEVVEGRANIFGLLRYLDYWFERHIAEEDKVFKVNTEVRPRAAANNGPVARARPEETIPA